MYQGVNMGFQIEIRFLYHGTPKMSFDFWIPSAM